MTRAEEFVYKAVEAGWLEIDSQGRVWRTGRQQTSRWGGGTRVVACQRERAEYKASNGYFQVRVMFDGVRGLALAHRLVWFHFNGRIPNKLTINHKHAYPVATHKR